MGKVIEAFRNRPLPIPQSGPCLSGDDVYADISMGNGWIGGDVALVAADPGIGITFPDGNTLSIDQAFSNKIDLLLDRQEKLINYLKTQDLKVKELFPDDNPEEEGPERVLDSNTDVCFTVSPGPPDDVVR